MTAVVALRWRLAVTIRSLRLVPPLLVLLAYLGIFLTQGNQAWSSIVAIDVVAAFALSLWASIAHAGSLARGHREITQASVGRPVAFVAELAGTLVVGLVAVVVIVVWPWALGLASTRPSIGQVGGALVVGGSAAIAGAAAGQLLDVGALKAPARFVVAIGILTVTVARPAITVAVSWLIPPVMDLAHAVNEQRVADEVWCALGTLVWSVVAATIAYVVADHFPATDRQP